MIASQKSRLDYSLRITMLKLFPFIVKQDIQSKADIKLTKVQGIR